MVVNIEDGSFVAVKRMKKKHDNEQVIKVYYNYYSSLNRKLGWNWSVKKFRTLKRGSLFRFSYIRE